MILPATITQAQRHVLIALVEAGPMQDDELLVSLGAVEALIAEQLACRICSKGATGFVAATYLGMNVYCQLFNATSIAEAMQRYREKAA